MCGVTQREGGVGGWGSWEEKNLCERGGGGES